MTRHFEKENLIALLATGDELTNGDIINSNAQQIAQKIFKNGMSVGTHMVVADHIAQIVTAIKFLLQQHQALIITGGLGPTSDDLTRQALSEALNRPLLFDEKTWDAIVARLKKFGYHNPPESNRQQALFPEGATIIPNPNGTAAGCLINYHQQWIFMLPGPPHECLSMVDEVVIPTLKNAGFSHTFYHNYWYLFGVSEGQIAEQLDAIAKPYDCTTGYRICFPYIEFKIQCADKKTFTELNAKIEKMIMPYIIYDGKDIASNLLRNKLTTFKGKLSIEDHATHGLLQSTLSKIHTLSHLDFNNQDPDVKFFGLNEYWEQQDSATTTLELVFKSGEKITTEIRWRDDRARLYALEWFCKNVLLTMHE